MKAVMSKNGQIYLRRSIRRKGKSTSENYGKLGDLPDLMEKMGKSKEEVLKWADEEALRLTKELKENRALISLTLNQEKVIELDEERDYNCGYLFLLKILYDLRIDNIVRYIKMHQNFEYDLKAIICDFVCARIISPSSKKATYEFTKTLLKLPDYELHDVYRSLAILSKYSDYIQASLYKNSNFCLKRDDTVLYYDCTNYYFETEKEDELRKYGKSKEHRPNPIVTMGLFMDGNGMPLAFDIYPGNMNEQLTLKPLEEKIIKDFDKSSFIYCSDSGLSSKTNKMFNSIFDRHYVITQSLKKLKKEYKDTVFDTRFYKRIGSDNFIDLKELDEANEEVYETVYYKEIPIDSKEMMIVTYSPKYKAYQRKIRQGQIERAKEMISSSSKVKKSRNNPNDPARFITTIKTTTNGEVASEETSKVDEDKIKNEEMYDGYYAVVTDLEDDVERIIQINKGRWQIEDCFKVMKDEFEGRPTFTWTKDGIKGHFMICFIALLVYRILEKLLDDKYTCKQIITTLRNMCLTKVKDEYYVPAYKRTIITDDLHSLAGFRLDYEILSKSYIRGVFKKIKKRS